MISKLGGIIRLLYVFFGIGNKRRPLMKQDSQKGSSNLALRVSLMLVLACCFMMGCTITTTYGPYYGKVVDKETKRPIEGAAVLAVFSTEQYGPGGAVGHFADAYEAATDKSGEFRIPKRRIVAFRVISGWDRYPQFRIFKPAYGCYPNHKDVTPMFVPNGSLPEARHVTIELPNVQSEARPERLRNAACLPSPNVPDKNFVQLRQLLDAEYRAIGY